MSETGNSTERKLYGVNRLLVGFIVGAFFGVVPMSYFYLSRDVSPRDENPTSDQVFTATAEPTRLALADPGRGAHGEKPFASRLTYELSQLPEEPPPPVARPAPAEAAAVARAAPVPPPEPPPAERIANARPISALPPDPRDRTGAIEREAQKAEYREPTRPAATAPQPRVFAGREVELKAPVLPDTPTRPIVASASDTRAEITAERARGAAQALAAKQAAASAEKNAGKPPDISAGPAIAGVTPITRAREDKTRPEVVAKAKTSAAPTSTESAAAGHGSAAGSTVEQRLAATREWLADAPQTTHTLQLMGTSSEEQLQQQLKLLARVLEPTRIHVFRTVAQGKPSITVVYGEFADRKSALQALDKLPPAIAANRPVLRTVNGIRTEMKQHKTDG